MTHQPFRLVNAAADAPYIFICDHASNVVPTELRGLGIAPAELTRHIAWDIGAGDIAEILARRFDAPAVICGTSRLVIDCNRHPAYPTSIPEISDQTRIPGNLDLTSADRTERIARYFAPYHDAVDLMIERKLAAGQAPTVLSIHSMTPAIGGVARPWQIAISWHEDRRLSDPMLAALRRNTGINVGDNQPYALDPAEDYSVPVHAMRRGLKHIQVEFRQDLVATPAGVAEWARIFGDALVAATA